MVTSTMKKLPKILEYLETILPCSCSSQGSRLQASFGRLWPTLEQQTGLIAPLYILLALSDFAASQVFKM